MQANLEKYKQDLAKLVAVGESMLTDLHFKAMEEEGKLDKRLKEQRNKCEDQFQKNYQSWYSQAHAVIRQILPQRLNEFEVLYKGEAKRKNIDQITYTIQDWLIGARSTVNKFTGQKYFNDLAAVLMRFNTQLEILKSATSRFQSSLFDIRQLVQADLLDSELDSARELLKNGFLRGAGVVAGVVLEKHLLQVCDNHNVCVRKQNPAIADLNDALKNGNVIDVPNWRFIQRLGDLRNLCGHKRVREPSAEEVRELIDGVDKVTKTLY